MSYPPPRPTSTPLPNPDGAGPSQSSDLQPGHSPSHSQQGQSPLDWANFMTFTTPPVQGGPAGMSMRPPPTPPAHTHGGQNRNVADGVGGSKSDLRGEQYNFARGIQMSQSQNQGNMAFHHPHQQSYGMQPTPQYQQSPQQTQSNLSRQGGVYGAPSPSHRERSESQSQLAPPNTGPSSVDYSYQSHRPPTPAHKNNGKGKADPPPLLHRSSSGHIQSQGHSGDGLTLDPAAFSRDIRFQVPSFLSTQMGGAPTFPPGGEAWSGFSGAGVFGQDGAGLTPGQIFSSMFNQQDLYHDGSSGNIGGGGDHSGNTWDQWNPNSKDMSGFSNGLAGGSTYYVNPNPSLNILTQGRQDQNGPPASNTSQGTYPPLRETGSAARPNFSLNLNTSTTATSPSQMTAPPLPAPGLPSSATDTSGMHGVQGSNRRNTIASGHFPSTGYRDPNVSQDLNQSLQAPQYQQNQKSPLGTGMGPMEPSALLSNVLQPQPGGFPYVPSISESTSSINPVSTINIASSSTAPYAPPSNTQQLLTAPVAAPFIGPSLTEGPGLYSTTGFDMVGVLSRVAQRKDPKTVLGPVDLSCSFAVVDVRRYDSPIVYASPTFCSLTGYELPQILGRNCRFLQSPDGEVVKGSKRKYTDNVAVAHLKRMLNAGKECQASLINYRRGGIPFINLVTVVPIPWESTEIVYHVGFQVDLVEQPNAILRNMRDGSYQVNYTVTNPPQPPLRPPGREIGMSGLSPDILDILGARIQAPSFGQGEDGAKMDWLKMVLENTDDFVHVLSLKGSFQYVSPSVRRVLEYEPEDLLNKNISDICHPSDIVPVMRELKDSTHAPTEGQAARHVSLVFRIRRKNSGYVWIECTGRLHVEPGKGRKAVILSGRARSVPALPWDLISKHGGLAEREFWAKITFDGIILHATSSVSELLGQSAEDVVGSSIFSLLPGGDNGPPHPSLVSQDNASIVSVLHKALKSITSQSSEKRQNAVTLTHKMITKTGDQVDVITILYAPKNRSELPARSESNGSSSPSSDDSSKDTGSDKGSVAGLKPACIVAQIKQLTTPTGQQSLPAITTNPNAAIIANLTNARRVAHAGSSNLFEELETTRGTSWQYELHQLRLLNRRLKDDVTAARAVAKSNAKSGKGKKRKVDVVPAPGGGYASGPGGGVGDMGPPPTPTKNLPEQFNAAPRHQLAPGFGLMAPGMANPYF